MKKKLRPYGNRVLVGEMGYAEEVMDSGIVLPVEVAEKRGLIKAIVLEVGTDVFGIEEHATVYFRGGREYEISNQTIVDCADIIAVEHDE